MECLYIISSLHFLLLLIHTQTAATDPDASNRAGTITYQLEGNLVGNRFQVDNNGNVYLRDDTVDRDYPTGYANWQVMS